jgi:hypothetical protein
MVWVSGVLAAANWYLRPERSAAWAVSMLLLWCMALALRFASGAAAGPIRDGVLLAGGVMTASLALKLAVGLGLLAEPDAARRATMALFGLYLVFTGNAFPKTLTPLSRLRCDAARVQAFQRFAGWAWVLTGLAFSLAWLLLPIAIADRVSMWVLMSGILPIAARLVLLRFSTR